MADGKLRVGEVNAHFLINEIFNGDAHKALKVARRYPQVQYKLTPMAIERVLIFEYLEVGLSDEEVVAALTTKEGSVAEARVRRLRGQLEKEKMEQDL